METFSALLALCAGNSPVTGEFPSPRSVTRSFDISFDLRLNKRLSKHSRDAGDLRYHRAHYDVTVLESSFFFLPYHLQNARTQTELTPTAVCQYGGCRRLATKLVPSLQQSSYMLTAPFINVPDTASHSFISTLQPHKKGNRGGHFGMKCLSSNMGIFSACNTIQRVCCHYSKDPSTRKYGLHIELWQPCVVFRTLGHVSDHHTSLFWPTYVTFHISPRSGSRSRGEVH